MRADSAAGWFKMRLMAGIEGAPSIREGCRRARIHPSTYYRWRQQVAAHGPEAFTPRDLRRSVSPGRRRLEAEVVAFALANPPWGPRRLFSELDQRGIPIGSVSQVWRILTAHGVNTRERRYAVITTARGLTHPDQGVLSGARGRPYVGTLQAEEPGDLVQMDCFHLGRLKGAKTREGQATVWQYTAIDVASSFVWAQTHTTNHAPSKVHTTALVHQVAADLAAWGWKLDTISTDSGNEFRNTLFTDTVTSLGATHRFIRAGRPQSNGKVEQVQSTILEECWKPTFVGYRDPTPSSATADLADYLTYYNHQRPHWGKWNNGKPPAHIITPNTGNMP